MRAELEAIVHGAERLIVDTKEYAVEEKEGHANFVTTIDANVQAYLMEKLHALLPEAALIGEEQENEALGDGYTWVVDPVDGTTNLIHDYHFSAISIALLKERVPVVGVIYQPYTKELFHAEKGKGAFLNGKPIHVSDRELSQSLIGFGTSPYYVEMAEKTMETALAFLRAGLDIRRGGSAALDLAYVACGRLDVYYELTLKPWDFAAGALLVTEAGGLFDMPLAEKVDFGQTAGVFACNQRAAQEARRIFDRFFA